MDEQTLILLLSFVFTCIAAPIMLSFWLEYRSGKRKKGMRGFEVRLNTGPAPVLNQKENDHG